MTSIFLRNLGGLFHLAMGQDGESYAAIVLFVVSLWFTDVNSIPFETVLQFLLNALRHGIL